MTVARDLLRRVFGGPAEPDGQSEMVEQDALKAGAELAADLRIPGQAARALVRPQTEVEAALAGKLLHGWLQNRYQTRYPLVLNLRRYSPAEAGLMAESVAHALRAIDADGTARQQAATWFTGIGGKADALEGATERPGLPDRLRDANLSLHAYAACAGALGRRTQVGRRFLDFLAAKLGVSDEVARSLNRRFGS